MNKLIIKPGAPIVSSDDRELLNTLLFRKIKVLKFHLLEVSEVDNPSDIKIAVMNDGVIKRIALSKYRTKFIFQNKIFALDISGIKDLEIDISKAF